MSNEIDVEAVQLEDGTLALPLTTMTAILRQIADNVEVWQQDGRSQDPVREIRAIADQIDAVGMMGQS